MEWVRIWARKGDCARWVSTQGTCRAVGMNSQGAAQPGLASASSHLQLPEQEW